MIKPKGRPATQCSHCRELRKNKQHHTRCKCGAGTSGKHTSACPCLLDKELCTCSKKKKRNSAQPTANSASSDSGLSSSPVNSTSPINIPISKNATFQSNGIDKHTRSDSIGNAIDTRRKKRGSGSSPARLSLLTNLTPSPPNLKANTPISGGLNSDHDTLDLLNTLDSLPITSDLGSAMLSPESFSSELIPSSNNDGYISDIESPLQTTFKNFGLDNKINNGIVATRNTPHSRSSSDDFIVAQGIFGEYAPLTALDNYQGLQNNNGYGIFDYFAFANQHQMEREPRQEATSARQIMANGAVSELSSKLTSSSLTNPQLQRTPTTPASSNRINETQVALFPMLMDNPVDLNDSLCPPNNSISNYVGDNGDSWASGSMANKSVPSLSSINTAFSSNYDHPVPAVKTPSFSANITNPAVTEMNALQFGAGLLDYNGIKPNFYDLGVETVSPKELHTSHISNLGTAGTGIPGMDDLNYGMYEYLTSST